MILSPTFMLLRADQPELTSRTYLMGEGGWKVLGNVSGDMFLVMAIIFPSASIQSISREKLISFIQNDGTSGSGKTKSMPLCSAISSLPERPWACSCGSSAISTISHRPFMFMVLRLGPKS